MMGSHSTKSSYNHVIEYPNDMTYWMKGNRKQLYLLIYPTSFHAGSFLILLVGGIPYYFPGLNASINRHKDGYQVAL